ncbi:sugar (pentulose or hexulose) kinase [Spirosoma lacussanchae]|uniref:FGGY-family carbohydrate kinase n=1 Tax=Spirosoma lacussanchae TaxID=1884249 RepID=UPI001107ED11|nr:FGGY-family carbohydrate kinase [Spirosoma lacussanchae]
MNKTPVVAVFDVGKTNKKLFLFDRQYAVVWERTERFDEATDDDGDPCEDLDHLGRWLKTALAEVLAFPQFEVQAVNFSAYGASYVYIGADGKPAGCLYNYLKTLPDPIKKQFYEQYGPPDELSVQTASPALGSLNVGLMLYRVKYDKPALYARIRYALHLPQYLSYLVTGQPRADLTSLGCHTLLWDFRQQRYHDWVIQEKLDQIQAPIVTADAVSRVDRGDAALYVGMGLHDSSAALIPYLASFDEPFVLISTGTWCISLNPFNTDPLTAEELQYDCLCYLTYQGQPVKASRLFAGHEHEQQVCRLADHFGVATDTYRRVAYDPALIRQLQTDPLPTRQPQSGTRPQVSMNPTSFADRDLTLFPTYELAYHQLMLDIVAQQLISTELVLHQRPGNRPPVRRLFVDGGFSHNSIYMGLLAEAFPRVEVWAASVAQATALGAALAIHPHWNPQPIPTNLIALKRCWPGASVSGLV